MKKKVQFNTTINGQQVKIETELELTESDLETLWAKKKQEVQQELFNSQNSNQEAAVPEYDEEDDGFEYDEYSDEEFSSQQTENSSYTPYAKTEQKEENTSTYTAYSSISTKKVDFPKSYHPENKNGYAAYHTFRVVVPHDFEPK